LAEAREAGVTILTEQKVEEIEKPERFRIRATDRTWEAEAVIIATGGLSIPKMGATDFAHRLARRFELSMRPPRPGLVPLTLGPRDLQKLQTLSGVSIDVIVSTGPISFRENLLFTHRGLSGPAILQISSYWQPGGAIRINLLPDHKEEALVASLRGGTKVGNWLTQILPKRFAEAWLDGPLAEKPGAQCSSQEITNLISRLRAWEVCPDGTEGYAKAEVTVGGLDTSALSSKNMETRAIPGLYFIGEAVDVTGWLGGYNFQWAWASGWAAGTVA
jgi:predicted Rossmann fold flavoprotein